MRRWIFRFQPLFRMAFRAVFVIPIYLYHACRNNARGTGAAPYCCTPRTPFSPDIPLAVLVPFRGCFFAVTPRPICGAGSVSLSCKNDFRIEISTAAYFLRRPHFFYRTLFLYCSSFLRRPPFLRGGVFLWVSLGDVEKGFGIMDKGIVIRRDGAGVSAGDCGFVGRIRRFLRKKEKYAENILLFCTFYWYQ